jgi:hypothetical protein
MTSPHQRNGRPAERLEILREDASGIMFRLLNVETLLTDEGKRKTLPWVDKKMKKVVACLQVSGTYLDFLEIIALNVAAGSHRVKSLIFTSLFVCHA